MERIVDLGVVTFHFDFALLSPSILKWGAYNAFLRNKGTNATKTRNANA